MLFVEEALIVHTTAERGARVLHIGGAAIAETSTVGGTTHRGLRGSGALHRHGIDRGCGIQHAHLVQLITQRQTTHRKRCLHFVL